MIDRLLNATYFRRKLAKGGRIYLILDKTSVACRCSFANYGVDGSSFYRLDGPGSSSSV